ncbi:hypothetical protein ACWGH2_32575 [Streptomyces sp. NPDC054871]
MTVVARDSGDDSPVAGRVLLDGSDAGATNVSFREQYDAGIVTFTVRCPGYADAQAELRVREDPKPPDRPGDR